MHFFYFSTTENFLSTLSTHHPPTPIDVGVMASSLSTKHLLGASSSSDGAARLGFLQSPQVLPWPSLRLPARRSQSRRLEIQVAGSTSGTYFRVPTFGESHDGGVRCVIDGCSPRLPISEANMQVDLDKRKLIKKSRKKEHHLWRKRDSAGSGQKALNLVRTVSRLPNEKEVVYGALDKWIAWETEFPLIAAAKALRILRKGSQWKRIIQVVKWMLSKGQGATMATYDSLLLAFDMDGRVDEAEMLWNMILHAQNRSISKKLFSRMISLYDHHNVPNKVIEVFADMEELGVKPDQDTVRRVARAFEVLGQEDKQRLVRLKYQSKWKYIHFNGERVRVRT
ncbi:pentatricopeptide repeat-containing protein At4g18975, chloroplastic [Sesamum indicum]|uniref:chorismate synthase n=1 Tax=Sesamum indicum TaxID=4182 RepID=A0A6I9T1S0_SESIN|nr:pentatricopeptide repeat-containing protein At4g18975, chloroplastic [Sesamum indicum]